MSFAVDRLSPARAPAVRDFRLMALRLEPHNAASSWEEEAVEPLSSWERRLESDVWLGCEVDSALVGLITVFLNHRMKQAHTATVGGMFVAPEFRRRGVATCLMQSAIGHMRRHGVEFATLTVGADNPSAQKLYARFGFAVCGRFDKGLCVDGVFHDELLMRARI